MKTDNPVSPIPAPDGAQGSGERQVEFSASVMGTIRYDRSDRPKKCVCCPDSSAHIYCRRVEYDIFESAFPAHFGFNAEEFIGTQVLYRSGWEGRRIRLTVEVLPAEPEANPDPGAQGQKRETDG